MFADAAGLLDQRLLTRYDVPVLENLAAEGPLLRLERRRNVAAAQLDLR